MGVFTNKKYFDIYNLMKPDKWYTAKELGVAPASLTAMVNRNLVEKKDTTPKQYHVIKNAYIPIIRLLEQYPSEFFGVYKANEKIGMLCYIDKQKVLDCNGNPYSLEDVCKIRIGNQEFSI